MSYNHSIKTQFYTMNVTIVNYSLKLSFYMMNLTIDISVLILV